MDKTKNYEGCGGRGRQKIRRVIGHLLTIEYYVLVFPTGSEKPLLICVVEHDGRVRIATRRHMKNASAIHPALILRRCIAPKYPL